MKLRIDLHKPVGTKPDVFYGASHANYHRGATGATLGEQIWMGTYSRTIAALAAAPMELSKAITARAKEFGTSVNHYTADVAREYADAAIEALEEPEEELCEPTQ
jgi:hypothetical protein